MGSIIANWISEARLNPWHCQAARPALKKVTGTSNQSISRGRGGGPSHPPSEAARSGLPGLCLVVAFWFCMDVGAVRAGTAYGSLNNFDAVNDNGVPCHGFEIELEDLESRDITYTYNWNHYGAPKIMEDRTSVPGHTNVIIRYASAKTTNGEWAAFTAVPSGPIAPTDGHQFTNPSINFGGEHFGVGYRRPPKSVKYHWLIDNGAGVLVPGTSLNIATPTFAYAPPAAGAPAQVQAVIEPPPPPEPPVLEFGEACWVKEIRTTTHNNRKVKLRDLVSEDPDDPEDKNWRNGEPDEIEVEWQLLQTEFNKLNGGANGELAGAPENLPHGDEVVTRRYEFYKYVGPLDEETGEAKADKVGPDGLHGAGIKTINDVEVDLATVVVVGEFIGSQMAAFDAQAVVGLIDHVQDGTVNELYPTRTLVIAGNTAFSATNWGNLPPGLNFNRLTGELSGTPTDPGVYQFTVEARAGNDPAVRKTYIMTVTSDQAAADALPPQYIVDTVGSPLEGGATEGDGAYEAGVPVTVTAAAAPGFVFLNWTDNGGVVSASPRYTFTNLVNRSLVANFVPQPKMGVVAGGGLLTLAWPTNVTGWILQESAELSSGSWTNSARPSSVVGATNQVTIPTSTGRGFFRLAHP